MKRPHELTAYKLKAENKITVEKYFMKLLIIKNLIKL